MHNKESINIRNIIILTLIILPLKSSATLTCRELFFKLVKPVDHVFKQPTKSQSSELIFLERALTATENTILALDHATSILKKEISDLNNKPSTPLFQKITHTDSKENTVIDFTTFQKAQNEKKHIENDSDKIQRMGKLVTLLTYESDKLQQLIEVVTKSIRKSIQATSQTKIQLIQLNRVKRLRKVKNAIKYQSPPPIMNTIQTTIDKEATKNDITEALTEVINMYDHLSTFAKEIEKKIKKTHSNPPEDKSIQTNKSKEFDDSFLPNIINKEQNQSDDYVDIEDALHEVRLNKNQIALAQEVKKQQRRTYLNTTQKQPSSFSEIIFLEKMLTAINNKQLAVDTAIRFLESYKRLAQHNHSTNQNTIGLSLAESIQTDILRYSLFPQAQAQQIDGMIAPLENESKILTKISEILLQYIRRLIHTDSKETTTLLINTFLEENKEDISQILNSNIIARLNGAFNKLINYDKIIDTITNFKIVYESNDLNNIIQELSQKTETQIVIDSN